MPTTGNILALTVEDMEELGTNKRTALLALSLLPLFTIFFEWADFNVKSKDGFRYFLDNKDVAILGLVFIVLAVVLKLTKRHSMCLYLLGQCALWVPSIKSAIIESNRGKFLSFGFYISLTVMLISLGIQTFIALKRPY